MSLEQAVWYVVAVLLTGVNVVLVALSLKLYTEFVKETKYREP